AVALRAAHRKFRTRAAVHVQIQACDPSAGSGAQYAGADSSRIDGGARMKRLIVTLSTVATMAAGVQQQGPRGGFGPTRQEVKLVKTFDKNGDGWLNAQERKAARAYVTSRGLTRGGRGFFPGGGPGGPSGAPGKGESVKPADVRTCPNTPLY